MLQQTAMTQTREVSWPVQRAWQGTAYNRLLTASEGKAPTQGLFFDLAIARVLIVLLKNP